MIGQTILNYRILEELGRGGMGIVYKAQDERLHRVVALKLLPLGLGSDDLERARFIQEARAASALNHPNVCTVYDITDIDKSPCLVMEFVDGVTLGKKVPVASVNEAVEYATQIAEALAEAHARGIIHRDIKSDNIMVNAKGVVKVMDFGLARLHGAEKLTKTSTTVGTLAYMAPELLRGVEADSRTDLFSLGAVLYEMLTGTRPFLGEHEAALMYEILNAEPKPVIGYRQDVPAPLLAVISDLLQKDPEKRMSSASETARRLRESMKAPVQHSTEKKLAVLYFENMSSDKESDYFCAGMTEDIITDLCKINELKVTPRADVLPFRNRQIPTRQVGEALQVNFILEGSVRKHANRIRISAQLVEVASGSHLWAERFDGFVEDVFDLQSDVARKIAESLKISLSPSLRQQLGRKPTQDLRAYDFYLRGRELISQRGKKNTIAAIRMLEQAVALDENFVAAYAAIGEACSYMFGWYDGDPQWLARAVEMSQKALTLDPQFAEAQFGMAMVRFYERRYDDTRSILLKVVQERPEYYEANRWLGIIADIKGEYDDALRWYDRCALLKPYSEEALMHTYMTLKKKGDDEAQRAAKKKMIDVGMRKLSVNPDDAVTLSRLAGPVGELGDRERALDFLDRVLSLSPDDGLILYNAACGYADLGETERAIECLLGAARLGYRNTREWIRFDPDLETVRKHPQYESIMKEFE